MNTKQIKQVLNGNAVMFLSKDESSDKILIIVPIRYNDKISQHDVMVYSGSTRDNFFGYELKEDNGYASRIATLTDISDYFNYLGVF